MNNYFGGRGLGSYNRENTALGNRENTALGNITLKNTALKNRENITLKKQAKILQQIESEHIINALKSLDIIEEDLDWTTNSKEKTLSDRIIPSNNPNYNKCKWNKLVEKEYLIIYIPTDSDALNECILPFGDKLLTSIHYTLVKNVGGHISFEGNVKKSKFNVHFGTHSNKSRGFWNVKQTLKYLNISETNFLKSHMSKCMVRAWVDFNGFMPSKESLKNIIN